MWKIFFKYQKFLLPVLLVIIALSVFYVYQISKRSLVLELNAPKEVLIGVPFELRAELSNQSGKTLKDVMLTVTLPDGAVFVGSGEDKTIVQKNFGDLGEGSLVSETYQVVFLKGRDSQKKLRATVSYLPANLGSRFESYKEAEVAIRDAGVAVELVGPPSVLNSEEFELDVIYRNVSDVDFTDLELKLEYPANFSFLSATVPPDKGKDTWLLGDLRKGSEGTFSIRGNVIGAPESSVEFKTNLKTTLGGRQYDLETKPFQLTIAPSPLSLIINLNDKADYIVKPGDSLNYVISYVNNTDTALRAVTIRAQLVGEMFDFNYLNTDAIFRPEDNTLIWNSQNNPSLGTIVPNSAGFVKFSIKAKEQYPIRRFGDKNFVLKINAEIESPTVPASLKAVKTFNIAKLESKVSGNIKIGSRAYFRDAASGIINKGAMPPRANQPTNFTVHWLLENFASDVSNLEIRAVLPAGVKFTGVAKSSFAPQPFYDEKDNQMVWQIDKLPANKGAIDEPVEAIFQIEAAPSGDFIGKYFPILGETTLRAVDNFTNEEIIRTAAPLSTALPDDATIGAQGGVVQP
jgi:hypothetical protein